MDNEEIEAENRRLAEQNRILREGLELFGNPDYWEDGIGLLFAVKPSDNGIDHARQKLAEAEAVK